MSRRATLNGRGQKMVRTWQTTHRRKHLLTESRKGQTEANIICFHDGPVRKTLELAHAKIGERRTSEVLEDCTFQV